jgi:TPR repeat protein
MVSLFLVVGLPALADLTAGQAAYDKRDYAAALQEFLPLAQRGDAIAQLRLGYMYEFGRGVPQNDKDAVRWFRAAAEQGNADAQFSLGFLYEVGFGRGVPQDYNEAVRWYRAAADQGNVSAQFFLGSMYEEGWGVPQDYIQAHMWFNLAASTVFSNDEMAKRRDSIATKMTPEEVSLAQRLAREWKAEKDPVGGGAGATPLVSIQSDESKLK